MKFVRIESVNNGFIVNEDSPMFPSNASYKHDPYVFQSFGAMVDWLNKNLDKPKDGPIKD
jgi:hypothetical protein